MRWLWVTFTCSVAAKAPPCDLPVTKIHQGLVPRRDPSEAAGWASAYGFSAAEWEALVDGDEEVYEYLRSLLEKGQRDWDGDLLEEEEVQLKRHLRRSKTTMSAVKRVVQLVQTNNRLGEMFGNRKMLEATASYYLLGFGVPENLTTFSQEIQSLQNFQKVFGIFNPFAKRYKRCLSETTPSQKTDVLCGQCGEFWSCAESPSGSKFVVRVTVGPPRRDVDPVHLQTLPGVRILEMANGQVFQKGLVTQLMNMFPNVRILMVNLAPDEVVPYPSLDHWASNILALQMHALMSSPGPIEVLCQLQQLRYVTFGGAEASEGESMSSFPECMGNFSELIHLKVVGLNLTGSQSLPSSLSNLKNLMLFEAFEQGRLAAEDEARCPGTWVPNRRHCVPGYVSRADGALPVWRCPVHGWNLWMDDMTLPWWQWKKLEKMHIDANFIYGTIPWQLPELWPKLRSLDLHDLKLTGPLPLSLTSLENLTQLQVQLNDLECPDGVDVVAQLLQNPKMRVLHLDANPRMCGCVPSEAPPFLHLQVGETSVQVGCDNHNQEL